MRKTTVTILATLLFISFGSSFSYSAGMKKINKGSTKTEPEKKAPIKWPAPKKAVVKKAPAVKQEVKIIQAPKYADTNKKVLNIGGAFYHKIQKGDTIWGTLILKNDVDPNHYEYYKRELLRLNPQIKDPSLIYVGDTLVVPYIAAEHKKKWVPPVQKKPEPEPKRVVKKKAAPKIEAAKVTKKKPAVKKPPLPKETGAAVKSLPAKTIEIRPPIKPKPKVAKKPRPKPKTAEKLKPRPKKEPEKKKEPTKVSDKLKFSILREFPPEEGTKPNVAKKPGEKPKPKPKVKKKPKPESKPEPKKVEKLEKELMPLTVEKPKPKKAVEKPKVKKKSAVAKAPAKKTGAAPKIAPKAGGPAVTLVPSTSGGTGAKGVSAGKGTGSVVMGRSLKIALESLNDKVVTKGTLYFPIKGKKPLKLDNSLFPVVFSGEKKIVLDYGNKVKKTDEDYIKNKFEFYDFVDVLKNDSEKTIIGKVLKASGFHSVRENREVKVGRNVKLVIRYDWLVEKDKDSFLDGAVKIIKTKFTEQEKVPEYIKKYLERFGFYISEVKVTRTVPERKARKRAGSITTLNSPREPKEMIRKLLDVIGVEYKKGAALKFHTEDKPTVYADFYIEIGKKTYLINLKPSSEEKKALGKKYGLDILDIDSKESRSKIYKKVLNLLQKDYRYGTFRLLGDKSRKPFLDVEVRGFFIGKKALKIPTDSGVHYGAPATDKGNVFVTEYKIPPTIRRLLDDSGFTVIEY